MIPKDERLLLDEKYSGVQTPEYFLDVERLKKGEPLAYVIGWAPFLGCKIFLDSHPLIPRPETEYWVEKAIAEMKTAGTKHCLDLCAGSGAIGVAVLTHIPDVTVDFGEIDWSHFPTIEKNIRENNINPARTNIVETDLWSRISGRYDAILANPPYLSRNRMGRIQESVLAHEPARALFADNNGFSLIEKIMRGLPERLVAGGTLYLEHEPEQSAPILHLAQELGMAAETKKDQFNNERYSRLYYSHAGDHHPAIV